MASSEAEFSVHVDETDLATVLTINGELDILTAPRLREVFADLAQTGRTELVIDARGIGFIDARGIRAFIEGRSEILAKGSRFNIVPSARVRRVIDLLDLGDLFDLFSSTQDALEDIEARV